MTFSALQMFLGQAVRFVQLSASQPVTIGCAHTKRLDLVRPLGLDFYQVHWYERFGWRVLDRPVADLGLDRPVMLGEFPGRSAAVVDVLETANISIRRRARLVGPRRRRSVGLSTRPGHVASDAGHSRVRNAMTRVAESLTDRRFESCRTQVHVALGHRQIRVRGELRDAFGGAPRIERCEQNV